MRPNRIAVDANEAVAHVAHRLSEVIAIYPITPASAMGEHADAWTSEGRPNLWGEVPDVIEMQSEAGAAGAMHGALQAGALATSFTASQGLLLMLPDMFKIAGEFLPGVLHVAARTVATHALSIFGDHSDVYSVRSAGFAMLCASSVQEAADLAAVAHAAALRSRVPFLHFFDGFRTSHEVATIELPTDDDLRDLVDRDALAAFRERALSPDRPTVRGTAHNPDAFFQAREAGQPFYDRVPGIVRETMDRLATRTGRPMRLVDYEGDERADRVVVCMGSACEALGETVAWLRARGERVGVVKVRLFRPLPADALLAALPSTARSIAVLDRAKEPGAPADPLHQDVVQALWDAGRKDVRVVAGRYGLSSKEFDPSMAVALFGELAAAAPRKRFTIGIHDDVNGTSLPWDPSIDIEPAEVARAVFYGLGSDGTVSANKSSIKILASRPASHAQGYFVYDSKKSGAVTVSHLRFGPRPIRSTYLVKRASFVACSQWSFLDRYDVLERAADGAVFLLNAPFGAEDVWQALPFEVQRDIVEKRLDFWVVDADAVAREADLGRRVNTIMQTCFFAISGVLPRDEAIDAVKRSVESSYAGKGSSVVRRNHEAIDRALAALHRVRVPDAPSARRHRPPTVPESAPDFVRRVTAALLAGRGDELPVSAFPADGIWPTGTARWERRSIAQQLPAWDRERCIQCNKCTLVCPHAAIRTKLVPPGDDSVPSAPNKEKDLAGFRYALAVAPDDCTGCTLCVRVCPARDRANPGHKALDMVEAPPVRDALRTVWTHFLALPEIDRAIVKPRSKDTQWLPPLFEYSGACAGCGETPYLKLLTQLFGDRLLIANATGCSSIYGGNLPTTPYCAGADGRGPAWANSLFEDNAEFGLGMRLAVDHATASAKHLLGTLGPELGEERIAPFFVDGQEGDAAIAGLRARVDDLRRALPRIDRPEARALVPLLDHLVPKTVWIVGGDGWAYDIGYGGLDHVLASGRDVNVLVLDTEVYSNTGGQQSKSTPLGATAKFAASGKEVPKKDLGLLAMAYGGVYVAQIAIGGKDTQAYRALVEAESFRGPSLVIAYSHCIAHGYELEDGLDQQARAVKSGYWPLYRYDPRRIALGQRPLKLDSGAPTLPLSDFALHEGRFGMLLKADPARSRDLLGRATAGLRARWEHLATLAGEPPNSEGKP